MGSPEGFLKQCPLGSGCRYGTDMLMAALLLRLLLAPLSHSHEVPWTYKGKNGAGLGLLLLERLPPPPLFVLQRQPGCPLVRDHRAAHLFHFIDASAS